MKDACRIPRCRNPLLIDCREHGLLCNDHHDQVLDRELLARRGGPPPSVSTGDPRGPVAHPLFTAPQAVYSHSPDVRVVPSAIPAGTSCDACTFLAATTICPVCLRFLCGDCRRTHVCKRPGQAGLDRFSPISSGNDGGGV